MPLIRYDTPESPLANIVANALTNEADTECIYVGSDRSKAKIRLYGAAILSARVVSPVTTREQELFYPGNDTGTPALKNPKIRASHFGSPAGPDGFGVKNKHGAARYAKYVELSKATRYASLKADLGNIGIGIYRDVLLENNGITIFDEMINYRESDIEETSMLNHLYLNRGDLPFTVDNPVTINGETPDQLLGIPGAGERIIAGESFYWAGFKDINKANVRMPDGSEISVAASYDGDNVDGALIWAPEGENAYCLEPVQGFTLDGNRGIRLHPQESGILTVSVAAVMSASR